MRDALIRLGILITSALTLFAGCAATPEATPARDAEAKRFESASRAAIIYIYRADGPSRGVSTIWMDGKIVGQSLPGTYFRVLARPGQNSIYAVGADTGRIGVQTRENNVYFVAMRVDGEYEGASTTTFRSVAPEVGMSEVARYTSMLETWSPGQWRMPL